MTAGLVSIDLGNLSEPATVLIERVSDAVGGIARPWQTRRVASAEADAQIILAEADVKATDIRRRAALRFVEEETRNQANIESITYQAIPHLSEDSNPGNVEDDFLRNFFDKCRLVSDEQMQDIWARILAGEANNPGKFSRKTINILEDMDNGDAELFSKLCCFVWRIHDTMTLLIADRMEIFERNGINVTSLADVESLGLIQTATFPYSLTNLPKQVFASYFERTVEITLKADAPADLEVGTVLLTRAGRQIGPMCQRKPIEDFFEVMCEKWEKDQRIESVRVLQ